MCLDCETGCSECHEAWSGGTSVCSGCDAKTMVPSGSECVEKCRPGQFQEYKACKGKTGACDHMSDIEIGYR